MNKPVHKNRHRKLALRSQTIAIIALSRRLRGADQGRDEEEATLSTSACCVTSTSR